MEATKYMTVLIGSAGVGKSCIKIQYKCGLFPEDPNQYEEICHGGYQQQVLCDEEVCIVDILDLNGHEDYVEQFLPKAEGFVLVYSITSRASFEEIQTHYYDLILKLKNLSKCPMVLVGNKCDVDPVRQVTTAEGQQLAEQYGIPFFELSAYNRLNVQESFRALIREMRKFKNEEKIEHGTNKHTSSRCNIM